MTLRVRIVAVVMTVVAVVVIVVGVSLHRSTESSLVAEIDNDLLARVNPVVDQNSRLAALDLEQLAAFRGDPDESVIGPPRAGRTDPFGAVVGFDALARVVAPNGTVRGTLDAGFDAPTDSALLAEARLAPVLSDGDADGERLRVVTAALPGASFVQLARPLDEVDAVLDDLRRNTVLIGALAIVGAGVAAWFIAGRTARPIRELTEATEQIAATGNVEHAVSIDAGTDEVGRLSASFTSMLDALAASRRQQRQLVMDASHELRTPLTSIRTNVDVLGRGHALSSDDRAAVVADIDAELGELSDLVAELVDLAADVRADEPVALLTLDEVAAPVVERARRRTEREITVEVARSVVMEARPDALARAIRNLIDNAAKFSPPGTPIRVEIDGGSLTVHDAGPGVPPADRERIFDRFHRVESSRTLPGSGLGLAIVRQVAEAHDGTVVATDSPDGGAAIGFRLPTIDP
ncbi:MAG: HAMP domain-containing sensor histidine kinase [Acidimicrobiales bacterium]|nr:HAMP domain-containing sensor histidine kinase [Acidimicrobiales bacterium]